jgi:nucleoside-diphosphate-sugar epimerase
VFLTGATGTVGSGIFEALAADGRVEVTCLVRKATDASRFASRGAHVVIGDMADESFHRSLRAGAEFEFIIHAAQAPYTRHPQDKIDRLERIAARRLEQLASSATRLMLFTGGVWSYGNGARGQPIRETTPLMPFAAARARVELVRELLLQTRFPWVVVDPPSMVYGEVGPVAELVRALRNGMSIEVLDDDSVLWSVVERVDLGRACVALLEHAQAGESFLVAETDAVSVPQFYQTIADAVGCGRIVRKSISAFASADASERERRCTSQPVDSSRLRSRTGWRPRSFFAETIRNFARA